MSFVLIRVDDRMIHGQVVVGWGSVIHPDRIILCHDEIAASPWEKELYEGSFSDAECKICVFSAKELLDYIKSPEFEREKTILILESPRDALRIYDAGIHFDTLNVGGLHFKDQKKELNQYIYVDSDDIQCLNELRKRSVKIEGQDVPGAKKVDIPQLMARKHWI